MASGPKIFIEGGPSEWRRRNSDQKFTLSEAFISVRADKLTYQRSLGLSEDSRFYGTGTLDSALCAFGNPDAQTREVSLTFRGSAESTIKRLQNAKALNQITDDETNQAIDRLTTLGIGAGLSYYPLTREVDSDMWFLEIVLKRTDFDDILTSYRSRRLTCMLMRFKAIFLVENTPTSDLNYLLWDNERQYHKKSSIELDFLSWVEPELQLSEWPF